MIIIYLVMGLFQRLFGESKPTSESGGKSGLTIDQLMQTDYMQGVLIKYRRKATELNPQTSLIALNSNISKFGGLPNLNNFTEYPCCDDCNTPLNFVLQLYQTDFPAHYFPEGKNLFQLFRCPNTKCPAAFSAPYYSDLKMFIYYSSEPAEWHLHIKMPDEDMSDHIETRVPDCYLKPQQIDDYPMYEDFDSVIVNIEKTYGEEMGEQFLEQFFPGHKTKIGGYPNFIQSSYYPICNCGKPKDFFFQLSSEDTEEGVINPVPDNWSPHHIMIGDLGNIYFYVCKSCGEQTIESYWDCS